MESGEGIERVMKTLEEVDEENQWNPVKELKVITDDLTCTTLDEWNPVKELKGDRHPIRPRERVAGGIR